MTAPLDMFTASLQMLNVVGVADTVPAEILSVTLGTWNRMAGQWNTRQRYAYFIRQQSFAFVTSKENYSIGAATNSPVPDFIVAQGKRPNRIVAAQLVLTDISPNVQINMKVINFDQYQLITIPDLSSKFPNTLYYQPTFPNGTLWPWPAFPTATTYELNLAWWDQMLSLALSDLTTDLLMPDGYENAAVLTLAEMLYAFFPGRANIDEIKRQARTARSDIQSVNVPPPKIDTTDGINGGPSRWNWRTRLPI